MWYSTGSRGVTCVAGIVLPVYINLMAEGNARSKHNSPSETITGRRWATYFENHVALRQMRAKEVNLGVDVQFNLAFALLTVPVQLRRYIKMYSPLVMLLLFAFRRCKILSKCSKLFLKYHALIILLYACVCNI